MHAPTNMLVSETSELGDTNERTAGRTDGRRTDGCRWTLGTAADQPRRTETAELAWRPRGRERRTDWSTRLRQLGGHDRPNDRPTDWSGDGLRVVGSWTRRNGHEIHANPLTKLSETVQRGVAALPTVQLNRPTQQSEKLARSRHPRASVHEESDHRRRILQSPPLFLWPAARQTETGRRNALLKRLSTVERPRWINDNAPCWRTSRRLSGCTPHTLVAAAPFYVVPFVFAKTNRIQQTGNREQCLQGENMT